MDTPNLDSVNSDDKTVAVLCPSCLSPNSENAKFCTNCNAPIGGNVSIDPVGYASSAGRALSDGVRKPRSAIVVVGMWILFVPYMVFYILVSVGFLAQGGGVDAFTFVASLGLGILALVLGFFVVKTTLNYIRHRKRSALLPHNHGGEPHHGRP